MTKRTEFKVIAPERVNVREILLDSPNFTGDHVNKLLAAFKHGQTGDVRQNYQELKERALGSRDDRDLTVAGIAAYLLARHPEAIDLLSAIKKRSGMASYYLALSLQSSQRFDEAKDALGEAERAGYEPTVCKLMQAGCVRMAGHLAEAEAMLRSLAREGATRSEYSYQMGCILADKGDTLGALEYFERAVDMDAEHARALFSLAQLNNQLGNDNEAIRLYEQMLSKPPFYLGAMINLGLLYEDREQYSPAAFCFRRALDADPTNERARLYLKDIESASDMYFDEDEARRSKELEQRLGIPISDFELSARSRNCLERAGIHSLGDLTEVSEEQLLAGKNFGETSLKEIRQILEMHGLTLGQNLRTQKQAPIYRPEELSPEERAVHEMMVSDLELSVRARKCLSRLGITTVGELISRSADELLSVRNFGVTSLNEIREKLRERDMRLRGD